MTYDYPVAACDGHDFPRLIDKRVPGVAAVVDDVVEGFENPVGKPVLSHELPDVFLAVEFWCARGGSGINDMLLGTFSIFVPCQPA